MELSLCDNNERFIFSVCLLLGHTFLFLKGNTQMKTLFKVLLSLVLPTFILLFATACRSESDSTCSHQWNDATCTTPKTCSLCNITDGTALGHVGGNATCESKAICTRCSNEYGGLVSHIWNSPTCVHPKTCSICKKTEGDALAHIGGTASCENKAICSLCNQTYGELLPHSWVSATCTTPKSCSNCSVTSGSALNHNWVNNICTRCNLKNEKEIQFDAAKQSYNLLNAAADSCAVIMYSVYGAWHFSIYEADDYGLSTQNCFEAFVIATDMDYDETLISLNNVLESIGYSDPTGTQQLAALRTFSISLEIVHDYYARLGEFGRAQDYITKAKEELKKITNEYFDYTDYHTLKEYYTAISGYFEFCYSPSGSFSQLSTTIDNYETLIRNSQLALEFTFG